MKPEEVRNLNWVKVENWKDITMSNYGDDNKMYIGKEDINSFVESIFRDISRKLDISSEKLIPLLKEENESFYKIMEKFYSKYTGLGMGSTEFKELKTLLRIPDISFIDKGEGITDIILEKCSKLSDEDKEKIVDALNAQIKRNFRLDAQKLIEYFNSLPDIEKFNVMKYLGLFDVKLEIIPK